MQGTAPPDLTQQADAGSDAPIAVHYSGGMSLRARSKYVPKAKPAGNAGLTLFCTPDGVRCHWVRLILAEKDVDSARIEFQTGSRPSEDLLVLNPSHRLPTLADRDAMIDSARVIAEYLDERYPHPPMMPHEPALRAALRSAVDDLERELLPLLAQVGAEERTAKIALEQRLLQASRLFAARGWFLGLDFTIVDCAWSALLWRLQKLRFPLPAVLADYAERAQARPAFQKSLYRGLPG